MAVGPAVIRQDDFSAGMWPASSAERIPRNGAYTAENALVDDTGGLYKRGGSTLLAGTSAPASQILWVWQGTLTGGNRTLAATATTLYSVSGGTFTSLGAYTGMASGANRPVVISGMMYLPNGLSTAKTYDGTTFGTAGFADPYFTSVANRVVVGGNDQVFFSGAGNTTFTGTDLWRIPGGVNITGLGALRDSAVVFTDQGTWVISNMALNLTDTAGNVQQRLDLYSPDLALWGTGAAGVVGYGSGLIIPARDGVWLMRIGATSEVPPLELLSRPITELYRTYVAAGYKPGQAAVFRGHYFLPILNGTTVVTVLICRLDLGTRPWTYIGESPWYAPVAITTSRDGLSLIGAMRVFGTELLLPNVSRLETLNWFDPSLNAGQEGTALTWPDFVVTTRDMLTGTLNQNTVTRVRVGYRLKKSSADPGPTELQAHFGGASDDAAPTTLTGRAPDTAGSFSTYAWRVGKRTRSGRFRIACVTPSERCTLNSAEMFVRSSGRQ